MIHYSSVSTSDITRYCTFPKVRTMHRYTTRHTHKSNVLYIRQTRGMYIKQYTHKLNVFFNVPFQVIIWFKVLTRQKHVTQICITTFFFLYHMWVRYCATHIHLFVQESRVICSYLRQLVFFG